jgi:hypothetical protein
MTAALTTPLPEPQGAVGVIVGRFQEDDIAKHPGHMYTIEYVLGRHHDVLLLLGEQPGPANDRHPLSVQSRIFAIRRHFPHTRIRFGSIPAHPGTYAFRSTQIDEIVKREFPGRGAVVYGSRDSVHDTYSGEFDKAFVPQVYSGSATEIRQSIAEKDSPDFRAGVIWEILHRPRIFYSTVDVLIVDRNRGDIAYLVQKDDEELLRFPGVFFDPDTDANYEAAANRAIRKEAPGLNGSMRNIGSLKIEGDWRYKKSRDGIITSLFMVQTNRKDPPVADGFKHAGWYHFWELKPEMLVPEHRALLELARTHWNS